jgi:uncharacterized protein YcfL
LKRFIIILSIGCAVLLAGCSSTPEKAAEKHFKETMKNHSGITTNNLKVSKVSENGDEAVVKIEADLKYDEEITLIKEKMSWKIKE